VVGLRSHRVRRGFLPRGILFERLVRGFHIPSFLIEGELPFLSFLTTNRSSQRVSNLAEEGVP
jgi:hypothetical protein